MKKQESIIPLYMKRFFSQYLPQQRNCSSNTIISYRNAIRLFLLYLQEQKKIAPYEITVRDLSTGNIMGFLNDIQESRKNCAVTRNARLAAIRSFVRYLLMMEPTLSCDLQSVLAIPVKRTARRERDFLTREEMDTIIDAPDAETWSGKRDRILFAVMYNTGARVSEIIGVKVSDVRLNPGGTILLHGKGRKERVLLLWNSTAKKMGKWIAGNQLRDGDVLFPNARGGPLTRSGVEKRLKDAVRTASKKCPSLKSKRVSPHTLRHTTAMHMLQSGAGMPGIAMWLGHESTETTHAYMTSSMKMKEDALKTLQAPSCGGFRFRPDDTLLAFLESI